MRASSLFSTLLLFSAFVPRLGSAQPSWTPAVSPEGRPEILVLGVWHMANVTAGPNDVFAPERQAQLPQLFEVLARFNPTKIALEQAFYRNDALNDLYTEYVTGEHELTRNERQQLGFRLARELGHEQVYAIDADGDYPLLTLQDYVKARGHSEEYEETTSAYRAWYDEWNDYLTSHTLLEALGYLNSNEHAAALMAQDYERARFGEPWNWAGPDLLADWFQRNIRIHGNIVHLADSPDDRVLVIIGFGHLAWLRHGLEADPHLRLRRLAEFIR